MIKFLLIWIAAYVISAIGMTVRTSVLIHSAHNSMAKNTYGMVAVIDLMTIAPVVSLVIALVLYGLLVWRERSRKHRPAQLPE